jgi:hypothetical protein
MAETSKLDLVPRLRPKCRNFDTVGKPYTCNPHLPPDNLRRDLAWTWFPWEYVTPLASSASQRARVEHSSHSDRSALHRHFLRQPQGRNIAHPSNHCRRPHAPLLHPYHHGPGTRHSGFHCDHASHRRRHQLLDVYVRSARAASRALTPRINAAQLTRPVLHPSMPAPARIRE